MCSFDTNIYKQPKHHRFVHLARHAGTIQNGRSLSKSYRRARVTHLKIIFCLTKNGLNLENGFISHFFFLFNLIKGTKCSRVRNGDKVSVTKLRHRNVTNFIIDFNFCSMHNSILKINVYLYLLFLISSNYVTCSTSPDSKWFDITT